MDTSLTKPVKYLGAFIFMLLWMLTPQRISAHPADEFFHNHTIRIDQKQVEIIWELTPGPLLAEVVWFEADLNRDGNISKQEAAEWGKYMIEFFQVEINQAGLDLRLDAVEWPENQLSFYSGSESIRIELSAPWFLDIPASHNISFSNSYVPVNSVNWFSIESESPIGFDPPQQNRGELAVRVGQLSLDGDHTLNTWESSRPMIRWQESDFGLRAALGDQQPGSARSSTAGALLMNFFLDNQASTPYIFLVLLIAIFLGIMHALSPGHGKTVVAAYLVGTQGVPIHAVALGLIVSITHTGTVFILGLLALIAARNLVLLEIFPVLELLSGLLILTLGLILVINRWQYFQAQKQKKKHEDSAVKIQRQQKGRQAILINQPIREEGPSHSHDPKKFGVIPKRQFDTNEADIIQWRSLIALGISSGLIPCPNAIAILLISVAVNQILFGLSMIAAFSLGMALTLIAIGLLIMQGKRLFQRLQWFDQIAKFAPLMSAIVLVGIGSILTLTAIPNLMDGSSYQPRYVGEPHTRDFTIEDASILFLKKDQAGLDQIFRMSINDQIPEQLTLDSSGIRNYFVSPSTPEVLYTTVEYLNSSIWLLNLATEETTLLLDCIDSICANPTWLEDSMGILYQRQDFSSQDDINRYESAYPSIWWLDINSRQTEPLFQDSQLPGVNPRFSPDGKYLSYFSISPMMVQIYQLETGQRHNIPSLTGMPPTWSPDSDRVILADVRENQGVYQNLLVYYDLTTETLTWLDSDPSANDNNPSWSPNGEWIAFNRIVQNEIDGSRKSQVWLMQPDKSNPEPALSHSAIYHREFLWAPDSQHLLYEVQVRADIGFAHEIHLLDIVTGEFEVLLSGGTRPNWAP